ncbi:ankyrin repeat domain-containing protein [Paenibacillus urinalis]|uniref:Ankyrin repeat domain-containing protein n=1 Tax=Paenibacillus urinalis TaxID=521520 RepID=A0AAX3N2T1_9BACL|nr:ankyrin repeat domain-containing protein [Paenibacillus urinalis]WDH83424.1 ankyrin repeat domain-containing protein [Paenibacillus urinalis]
MENAKLQVTALFEALIAGDKERVSELLTEQPQLANTENEDGLTPLAYAGHLGFEDIVQTLIDHGAEVNAVTHSTIAYIPSNTALHATIAGERSLNVIKLLLSHGADPNIVDSDGHTALHSAAYHTDLTEILQLLLDQGAEVSSLTGDGETALQIAEKQGNEKVAAVLKQMTI